MYFSPSSVSKRLVLVHISAAVVAIQLLLIRSVSSINTTNAYLHHKCIESQGKFQPGSEYEKNVNKLIHFISTGNFRSGFEHVVDDKTPESVTLIFQCRGDSYGPKCRSCYAAAVSGLRRRCPVNKGRIIWYDQCFLEISSNRKYGKIDYDNNFCMSNTKNVSGDPQVFKQKMISFLENLGLKASKEDNIDVANMQAKLYATGEERVGTKKVYAMVQCTKDLLFKACYACLEWILFKESDCCDGKLGGRVLSTSCNYRYELYPFIKTTA